MELSDIEEKKKNLDLAYNVFDDVLKLKDKKAHLYKAINFLNDASKIIEAHEYPENYERIIQYKIRQSNKKEI